MKAKLLHQCGHNSKWNKDAFEKEDVGDGLILSPVHWSRDAVQKLPSSLKSASLFDPQFYLPSSQKQKLKSYDFFPETISGGFDTNNFSLHALEAARMCVEFQIENEFSGIVIPTRYFSQMVSDFTERQSVYSVEPFLEALSQTDFERPVYLSIVMTSHMIKDETFRTRILNWLTSYQQIDGVYLIPDCERSIKQVDDSDFLEELLAMLHQLREIDLEVILGYQNTEGLLSMLVPEVTFTFGTFENTRIFSIDKFLVADEERRGPKARIYLPGLLNWIQLSQAKDIRTNARDLWDKIHQPTKYSETALEAAVEPYFNQPGLYKHHFEVFKDQVNQLAGLETVDRYENIRAQIHSAQTVYEELDKRRFELEKFGKGDYLAGWLTAINRHWRNYLS